MRAIALTLLAAFLLSGCAAAPPLTTLAQGNAGNIPFSSVTLPGTLWEPLMPGLSAGKSVAVNGTLALPSGSGRVPAVVLTHGCSGVTPAQTGWADQLNQMGIATLVLDGFTGRGIQEICTGRFTVNTASLIVDAYRARDLLATHPRNDPSRIALMGFSFGGRTAVWASLTRFQQLYGAAPQPFTAYLVFYPTSCYITLAHEEQVSGPIRTFHGDADDWTPIVPCRQYVERMRRAGRDVALFEYPGAHHGFDNPRLPALLSWPEAISPRNCAFVEREGKILDPTTGRVAGVGSSCFSRGIHAGYSAEAHRRAVQDVRTFLAAVFRLN